MQVRFTHLGCFIEEKQGQTILAMNDVDNAMFAKGQKVELDIGMWHKWIGHVNFQRLQELQAKQVVFGLPKFSGRKAQVCEVCRLGKQHRLPFPCELNWSHNKLDLIHLEVWGPTQNVSLGGVDITSPS